MGIKGSPTCVLNFENATGYLIGSENKGLRLILDNGPDVVCDSVLYATGRRPMTGELGLENVAVKCSRNGAIRVDSNFMTDEPSIYAIGDVIDRVALTPVALAEGQIVANYLFSQEKSTIRYENIPSAVFSLPNLGTVGYTEQEALERNIDIDVYVTTTKPLKHALTGSQNRAMLKLIVDRSNNKVVGLHMVGDNAGELVQGFTVAINCGATKSDFDKTIGIHPTMAEEFVTMRSKRAPIYQNCG